MTDNGNAAPDDCTLRNVLWLLLSSFVMFSASVFGDYYPIERLLFLVCSIIAFASGVVMANRRWRKR